MALSRKRRRWLAAAAGGALLAGGGYVALGPAAPWIVDHLADGARVWRLGRIDIEGVTGRWIGDLRARRISIADDSGIWIDAYDVDLAWRPIALAFGAVRIDATSAAHIVVGRAPVLLEPRPSSGIDFDVVIRTLNVERITLNEAVLGEEAQFAANLQLDYRSGELMGLDAQLRRLDSDADRLVALYRPDEDYALNVDVQSDPGGIIARALGVGDAGLVATARGEGTAQQGSAVFNAAAGEAQLLSGTAQWNASRWSIDIDANAEPLPFLHGLQRRLGSRVALSASGERVGAFQARVESPFVALDLAGELNEDRELVGPAQFVATTDRLSRIARESPFELGAARLEGELRRARGTTAIRATLDARSIEIIGRTARFTGPVEAALNEQRFTLSGDLRSPADSPPLFANGRLQTRLAYDRQQRRFTLDQAQLTSDAAAIDAQGRYARGDGEFTGEWRARQLGAFIETLGGQASGRWRALSQAAQGQRAWIITADGRGAGLQGDPAIVSQLLGPAPSLTTRLRYANGAFTVENALLDGARLRAGAVGRIVSGQADLALEASATGPITLGAAEISGAVDATGRLTGRLARPTLSANATLSSFRAGGVVVDQPVLDFTLAPAREGYSGRAAVLGTARSLPLNASANVGVSGNALRLTNVDAQWGALSARGHATLASAGVTGELGVTGSIDGLAPATRGQLVADVALAPQRVSVNAQIINARSGELFVRAATLHAEGPLGDVALRFNMRGALGQAPLAFAGVGRLDTTGATTIRLEGRGQLGDSDVFTRAPMTAAWRDGGSSAALNVALGDGVLQAQWEERGRAVSGSAQVQNAPIAPLAQIWGERATGSIDGRLALTNARGGGLSGDADLTVTDARLAGRQRGTLDMRIVGDLDPSRLRATLNATSSDGLVARFEADAPVTTSADPIRIALAPERRGRATWSVSGPAQTLWAAARLQDQSLQGQIEGDGELIFGAGYLSGSGEVQIASGRFEDKLTGITLLDLNARIAVGDQGVRIETFAATGPGGGRLTASGGSANQREGQVVVNLQRMRVIDRPDARATASGELTLAWRGMETSVSGNLNILEANLDIAADPTAGIPTLDVIEINRPGEFDEVEPQNGAAADLPAPGGATLNVNITASDQVFTRGRGVEAEWALDLALSGTADNPAIIGTARAIRGTISLSGQPFVIDEATIAFNGDPMNARINLTATREARDLTAYLRITGTARDPEIAFTSDPALPEDEILPQVLFGRSMQDLSAFEAAQLAASLAALSGRGTFNILDTVRAAAGLDRFSVRQEEGGGVLVTGGLYLTRDVYVEVGRTGSGQAQTSVEWMLRPRLVLITSFLADGNERVSLRWRRETD